MKIKNIYPVIAIFFLIVIGVSKYQKQIRTFKLNDKMFYVNSVYRFYPRFIFSTPPSNDYIIKSELDSVASFIISHPEMIFEIGYHTYFRGNDSLNLELSTNRAKIITQYLNYLGVDSTKIKYKGYGETQPIYDSKQIFMNDRYTHKEKEYLLNLNKRAELKILSIDK